MWGHGFLQARSLHIPRGMHGGALEVRYRLYRTDRRPVPRSVHVDESLTVLADPYQVGSAFRSGPGPARNGLFNDIYRLEYPEPLPEDFRLEMEQTYTANGTPVSGKNKIVYAASYVRLYVWERGAYRFMARGMGRP